MRISFSASDHGRAADARCLDPKKYPQAADLRGFLKVAFMSDSPNCLRAYSAVPAV
jgi:hypothetical protein